MDTLLTCLDEKKVAPAHCIILHAPQWLDNAKKVSSHTVGQQLNEKVEQEIKRITEKPAATTDTNSSSTTGAATGEQPATKDTNSSSTTGAATGELPATKDTNESTKVEDENKVCEKLDPPPEGWPSIMVHPYQSYTWENYFYCKNEPKMTPDGLEIRKISDGKDEKWVDATFYPYDSIELYTDYSKWDPLQDWPSLNSIAQYRDYTYADDVVKMNPQRTEVRKITRTSNGASYWVTRTLFLGWVGDSFDKESL